MDESETRHRVRKDDVSCAEVEGEVVVLDLRRSEYLSVNEVGALLWRLLQAEEGASAPELAEAVSARYGIPPERAAGDVRAFLDQCEAKGLLEVAG